MSSMAIPPILQQNPNGGIPPANNPPPAPLSPECEASPPTEKSEIVVRPSLPKKIALILRQPLPARSEVPRNKWYARGYNLMVFRNKYHLNVVGFEKNNMAAFNPECFQAYKTQSAKKPDVETSAKEAMN
jgi:hypothetical protein